MGYYGDFMGFQFGEYHSYDLGLVRVSDGSRYTDPSVPNFTDTVTKVPGGDGTYYWDSFYSQRTFNVQCAFDNLNEAQIRRIRQIFDAKVEDWLIFDETPFKKYRVKVQAPPQMKYIAFNEGTGRERIYKGELTLQFISYTPYAIQTFKYIDQATYVNSAGTTVSYPNKNEWQDSVSLLSSSSTAVSTQKGNTFYVYNPGDAPTDTLITFTAPQAAATMTITYTRPGDPAKQLGQLILTNIVKAGSDSSIIIDSARNLIYGVDSNGNQTGNLYNKYITAGDFFKIEMAAVALPTVSSSCDSIHCATQQIFVDYNYLYY